MKGIKRISIFLIGTLMMPMIVNAAGSASIYANSTVVNGNEVTATVTLKNVASWNIKVNGSGATKGCSNADANATDNGQNTTKKIRTTAPSCTSAD